MFIEDADGPFGSVDLMVVGWDKLDVQHVALNVLFNGFRAFIVHYHESWLVILSTKGSKDVSEGRDEGGISA